MNNAKAKSKIIFFLILALFLGALNADAQKAATINLNWGEATAPVKREVSENQPVNIKFDKLTSISERKQFLDKSTLQITDKASNVKSITLKGKTGVLESTNSFSLTDLTGKLSAGDQVSFTVNYGNVTPFLIAITVKEEKAESITNAMSTAQVDSKIGQVRADFEGKISRTNANLNDLSQRVGAIGNLPLTNKEKKQQAKLLAAMRADRLNNADYQDCPACEDRDGDLIYDFKCKLLVQARLVVGNEGKGQIDYYVVNDLRDIKAKDRRLLRFKIAGINRYLYDVEVTVDDITFKSDTPALWSSYFGGTGNLAGVLADKLKTVDEHQVGGEDENEDPSGLINELQIFEDDYNKLLEYQLKAYLLCPTAKCCGEALPTEDFSYYSKQLTNINYKLLQLELTTLKGVPGGVELNEKITAKQATYDKMETACALTDKIEVLTKDISKLKESEKDKIDSLNKILTPLKTELSKLGLACDKAAKTKLSEELLTLRNSLPFRQAMDKVRGALPTIDDLRKLYLFDKNIARENFFYRLPPIYPEGEKLALTIDINARDTDIATKMGFLPTYHDKFNLNFSIRSKTTFSFSSGPFVNVFANNSLKSYDWISVPSSGNLVDANASYRLVENGSPAVPYGLGAFANVGRRFGGDFGLSLTFGVGASIEEKPLPTFMLGLTPSFGIDNRILISFGIAASQSRTVKSELYGSNLYATQPTLEYRKQFRPGAFISLSYAILKSETNKKSSSKSKQ
ncbi:hypothetical protein QWY86_05485 [Pedobacter aquatilis]|uniref:hypothetical protein n=1 Tax=Pedobacter aquatilis TaxID=351343 RepID=UPI0025B32D1D|nr:hypothetical protein [Pedobacter aquatilis]MDN3586109.1 hypothetical protein [Pedobacter aquatilis]